jgi:hypothetical protein
MVHLLILGVSLTLAAVAPLGDSNTTLAFVACSDSTTKWTLVLLDGVANGNVVIDRTGPDGGHSSGGHTVHDHEELGASSTHVLIQATASSHSTTNSGHTHSTPDHAATPGLCVTNPGTASATQVHVSPCNRSAPQQHWVWNATAKNALPEGSTGFALNTAAGTTCEMGQRNGNTTPG